MSASAVTAVTLGGGTASQDTDGTDDTLSTSSISESASGDATDTSVDDSTSGGSTGDDDDAGETETSTTGEPATPGQPTSQLVSAGARATSESYTVVFTLGQPSALQSTHASPSYRLQGGLMGANGSPP